jgi:integrase
MAPEAIYKLRDKAAAAHKRRFANYTVQVLRLLFNWGIRRNRVKINPAVAVELIKPSLDAPQANRPWSPAELDAVLDAALPELRVGIALGAYVGMREGDVITAAWACYDGARIVYRPLKTKTTSVRGRSACAAACDPRRHRARWHADRARGRRPIR